MSTLIPFFSVILHMLSRRQGCGRDCMGVCSLAVALQTCDVWINDKLQTVRWSQKSPFRLTQHQRHTRRADQCKSHLQAYGAGQFYPGMPGARFVPPHQQPAGPGHGAPAAGAPYTAGGYTSYAPPAAGWFCVEHATARCTCKLMHITCMSEKTSRHTCLQYCAMPPSTVLTFTHVGKVCCILCTVF